MAARTEAAVSAAVSPTAVIMPTPTTTTCCAAIARSYASTTCPRRRAHLVHPQRLLVALQDRSPHQLQPIQIGSMITVSSTAGRCVRLPVEDVGDREVDHRQPEANQPGRACALDLDQFAALRGSRSRRVRAGPAERIVDRNRAGRYGARSCCHCSSYVPAYERLGSQWAATGAKQAGGGVCPQPARSSSTDPRGSAARTRHQDPRLPGQRTRGRQDCAFRRMSHRPDQHLRRLAPRRAASCRTGRRARRREAKAGSPHPIAEDTDPLAKRSDPQ